MHICDVIAKGNNSWKQICNSSVLTLKIAGFYVQCYSSYLAGK